jgi:hypothetical protein
MAQPLGPSNATSGLGRVLGRLLALKKKACKKKKCSNWKGGKCRCGRD